MKVTDKIDIPASALNQQQSLNLPSYQDIIPDFTHQNSYVANNRHAWQEAFKKYLLKNHIKTDEFGFKIANFNLEDYSPSFEPLLRQLGVDYIQITPKNSIFRDIKIKISQDKKDLKLVYLKPENGYFIRPQKISWNIGATTWEEHLNKLDGKNRRRLNSKLRKSENVETKLEKISEKNFNQWLEIYEQEIVNRERGKSHINKSFLKKDNLDEYRMVVYRDKDSNILGGAIIYYSKQDLSAVIGYAAYKNDAKQYELPTRTFYETLKIANQESFQRVSHGWEDNMYGHHLTSGLMDFKAGLGLLPQASEDIVITKFLKLDNFDTSLEEKQSEVIFYSGTNTSDFVCVYISDNHKKIIVPNDSPLMCYISKDFVENKGFLLLTYNEIYSFLKSHPRPEEVADNIKRLGLLDVISQNRLDSMSNQTSALFEFSVQGHKEEYPKAREVLEASSSSIKTYELQNNILKAEYLHFLTKENFNAKLAFFISDQLSPLIYKKLIPELVDKIFGEIKSLEDCSTDSNEQYLLNLLNRTQNDYTALQFKYFIAEINNILHLDDFFENFESIKMLQSFPIESQLNIDDAILNEFFSEPNKESALKLVNELCYLAILSEEKPFNTNWVYPYITETIKDKAICDIKDWLEEIALDKETLFEKINFARLYDGSPYVHRIVEILEELSKIIDYENWNKRHVGETPYDTLVSAIKNMLTDNPSELQSMLYLTGKDPNAVQIIGRRQNEIIIDILNGLNSNDLKSLCYELFKKHRAIKFEDLLSDINDEIEDIAKNSSTVTPKYSFNQDYLNKLKLVESFMLLSDSLQFEAFSYLHKKLNLEIREYPTRFGFHNAEKILLNLVLSNKSIESITIENLFKFALEFAKLKNFPELLIQLNVYYPQHILSNEAVSYIKKNYFVNNRQSTQRWQDYGFALLMLRSKDTRDYGIKLIRRLKYFHYHPFSHDFTGQMSSFQLQNLLKKCKFDLKTKKIIEKETIKLIKRSINTDYHKDVVLFSLYVLGFLKFKNIQVVKLISNKSKLDDAGKLYVISNILSKNTIGRPLYDGLRKIFISCLNSNIEKWYYAAPQLSINLLYFHWDKDFGSEFNQVTLDWMKHKASFGFSNDQEIKNFLIHYFLESKPGYISYELLVSLILIKEVESDEVRHEIFDQISKSLATTFIHTGVELYGFLVLLNEAIYSGEDQTLLNKLVLNRYFLTNFDWCQLGFSEIVTDRIKDYAAQPECSDQTVSDIVRLLFTCNLSDNFSKYWLSNLFLNVEPHSFSNLKPLFEYSRSMEHFKDFANNRISDLLLHKRNVIAKQLRGGLLQKINKLVDESVGDHTAANDELVKKRDRIAQYQRLYEAYTCEKDQDKRKKIKYQINSLILEDYPPTLVPELEIKNLIKYSYGSFYKKVEGHEMYKPEITEFIKNNFKFLISTKILDRLTQFSNFADQDGMRLLMILLNKISDSSQSKFYNLDLLHKDHQIKSFLAINSHWAELKNTLLKNGIEQEVADSFIDNWSAAEIFKSENSKEYLFATNDIESWIKHGEEPVKTCHSLTRKAGDMDQTNWNYQFGACANTNGRPIARILLPQLKLFQFIENGKIIARTVAEVTVDNSKEKPELHILVEVIYGIESLYKNSKFRELILKYCAKLGVLSDSVTFADDKEESYPIPLQEDYRIFRDYFRTNT